MPDPGRLADRFHVEFGVPPDAVWSAPGRVNLIGEHTDYNGGLVLPLAIARRTAVALRVRADDRLRLRSRQHPDDPYDAGPGAPAPRGWPAYAAGVLIVARRRGGALRGVDLMVDSDLPEGAGLSSSAALTCAVTAALTDAFGLDSSGEAVAAIARAAETDVVGVPCGAMDQLAAVWGRAGHAVLIDCGTGRRELLPFTPATAGLHLVLVDTGVRHALADGEYAERRRACGRAAAVLGVPTLSHIRPEDLDAASARLTEPGLRAALRHVVTENSRVAAAADALRAGRPSELGPLLTASHGSLRDDFRVSGPELDLVVDTLVANGAFGARLTGAGFGGSVVALLPRDEDREHLAAVLAEAARRAGHPRPSVTMVEPADGVRRDITAARPDGKR